MAKAPFRITSPRAPAQPAQQPVSGPPGRQVVQSGRTGDPLPPSSQDAPGRSPPIKWGPPKDPHKPTKNTR